MADSKLDEFFDRAEVLRLMVASTHEQYLLASQEYDWHRKRLTTLGVGSSKVKRFLDGQEV